MKPLGIPTMRFTGCNAMDEGVEATVAVARGITIGMRDPHCAKRRWVGAPGLHLPGIPCSPPWDVVARLVASHPLSSCRTNFRGRCRATAHPRQRLPRPGGGADAIPE